VNVSGEKLACIMIHEGDNIDLIVDRFSQKYRLSKNKTTKLRKVIYS